MAEIPSLAGALHSTKRVPAIAPVPEVTSSIIGLPGRSVQKARPSMSRSLVSMVEKWRSSSCMHPVNWLLARSKMVKPVRLPSSAGISPVNWLSLRGTAASGWRGLPSSVGISPVNWLSVEVQRACRLERSPSAVGISPVNWLLWSHSVCRLERFPSSVGISPVNWLWRGTAVSGWTGSPVPSVSPRSTG